MDERLYNSLMYDPASQVKILNVTVVSLVECLQNNMKTLNESWKNDE